MCKTHGGSTALKWGSGMEISSIEFLLSGSQLSQMATQETFSHLTSVSSFLQYPLQTLVSPP